MNATRLRRMTCLRSTREGAGGPSSTPAGAGGEALIKGKRTSATADSSVSSRSRNAHRVRDLAETLGGDHKGTLNARRASRAPAGDTAHRTLFFAMELWMRPVTS